MKRHLPHSYLSDEDFLKVLLSKENPTAEDVEAALRIELLLSAYGALLERVYTAADNGIKHNDPEALHTIRDITSPPNTARLQ